MRHVDVAVAHENGAQVLLAGLLAAGRELRHGARRRCLGALAAGVGVHLGVHHQHVHVGAACHHVVKAAEADVVGPAVAAEHPERLLRQLVLELEHLVAHFLCAVGKLAHGSLRACHQGICGLARRVEVIERGKVVLAGGLHRVHDGGVGRVACVRLRLLQPVRQGTGQLLHARLLHRALLHGTQEQAQRKLGVVLEQAVGPGGAEAALVHRVGDAGERRAPGLRAARGVRPVHAVAEQLGEQLGVGRLAAAGAGGGELQQRLLELRALHGIGVERAVLVGEGQAEVPQLAGLFGELGRLHVQRACRAHVGAAAAAGAVELAHLDGVARALGQVLAALERHRREPFGRVLRFVLVKQVGADGGVGAHEGAAVALDARFGVPRRRLHGDAALLVGGQAHVDDAVLVAGEGADGQAVALLRVDGAQDVLDHRRGLVERGVRPAGGHSDFHALLRALVDGRHVLGHHGVALARIGLAGRVLHVVERLLNGHQARDLEERRLQHGVDVAAQAHALRHLHRVHGEQADAVLRDVALHLAGQVGVKLFGRPAGVEQEGAAGLHFLHHVVLEHVALVVAGHEVRALHVVGAADGLLRKAQVGLGHAEGLLGVVLEVCLRVHVGAIAQDADGVVVRAHGAVAAQAPELAAVGVAVLEVFERAHGKRQVRHVVVDADGEAALGLGCGKVVEHGNDLRGVGVLGCKAVAAADDRHLARAAAVGDDVGNVQVQRLACRAHALAAVEHRDALHGFR